MKMFKNPFISTEKMVYKWIS